MHINYLDLLSASLCFTSVVCLAQNLRLGWLFSLLAAFASGALLFTHQLYANALLNLYFISVACYGWIFWKRKTEEYVQSLPNPLFTVPAILFTIMGSTLIICHLHLFSFQLAPLDVMTTLLSATAAFLTSKKVYQSWLLWGINNCLYLFIFFHAGLWFNTLKFACFIFITARAYAQWEKRFLNTQTPTVSAITSS